MEFSIKDFYSKCDQIRKVLHVWHGSEYASDVVLFFISNFEHITEAVFWRFSVKNMFLKILQYSQQNTCVGVSF